MKSILAKKSFDFALKVIKLFKYLQDDHREYILSKQILRSATSIGANIEEAIAGQSIKDFVSKNNIALKEARETHYWLRLLHASNYLIESDSRLLNDCEELIKMLTSTIKTSRKNHKLG